MTTGNEPREVCKPTQAAKVKTLVWSQKLSTTSGWLAAMARRKTRLLRTLFRKPLNNP
jgi:hypothetical protein